MKKTKVFLLDDHKIVRDGLKSILQGTSDFEVSGEDSNPETFIANMPQLKFDLVILDVSLPHLSGLEVIKSVKAKKPNAKIVMLSMHENPEYMFRSLREGANSYLPKDIESEEFIEGLRQVMKKGSYYPSNMNFNTRDTITPVRDQQKVSILLTTREIEILSYMSKGMSSRQIAETLSLSPRTVEAHRVNIMKKLGTNNSAETITLALKLNLIEDRNL